MGIFGEDSCRSVPGARVVSRIPGRDRMERVSSDDLISCFLVATNDLSEEERAALAGVGVLTLRRWVRGGVRRVSTELRKHLTEVLGRAP